jgi:hypothetical protein
MLRLYFKNLRQIIFTTTMHSGNRGETGILHVLTHARRGPAGSAEPTWALSEWLTTKRD